MRRMFSEKLIKKWISEGGKEITDFTKYLSFDVTATKWTGGDYILKVLRNDNSVFEIENTNDYTGFYNHIDNISSALTLYNDGKVGLTAQDTTGEHTIEYILDYDGIHINSTIYRDNIYLDSDKGYFEIKAGEEVGYGASATFYGSEYSTNTGEYHFEANDGTDSATFVGKPNGTYILNNQCFIYSVKLSNQTRDDIKTIAASYGKNNIAIIIPYMQFAASDSPDGQSGSAWFLIVNYWSATNVGIRAVCNFKNVTATSLYYNTSWGDWNTEGINTDISSTITKQSTTSGTITLYKCGKMRHLIFKDVASTSTGTVNICTLPDGSRPPANYEYFVVNGTASGESFVCDFGTNGYVHIYGYSTASVAVYGSITYFVN